MSKPRNMVRKIELRYALAGSFDLSIDADIEGMDECAEIEWTT